MSKISIKTDFVDGEKLFAQQLNNNFLVIQEGVNANEENLQEVIDQAIVELDNELEEITADRGWDWNGGDRVTFFKGTTSQVNTQEIKNGQMLYNTETGETALDDNNSRIVTGSGNVIAISENAPTNPATKEWIKPSKMLNYAASYVVNSMTGSETDKAPSVAAIKDYVDEVVLYSSDEGTTGNLTLLDSVANYKYIEISGVTQDGTILSSQKFYSNKASNFTIQYNTTYNVSGGVYPSGAKYKFNGNTMTVDFYYRVLTAEGAGISYSSDVNDIKITRIVGHR